MPYGNNAVNIAFRSEILIIRLPFNMSLNSCKVNPEFLAIADCLIPFSLRNDFNLFDTGMLDEVISITLLSLLSVWFE